MRIDLTQPIANWDGRPYQQPDGPVTLKSMCILALNTPMQMDAGLSPAQRDDLTALAERIHEADALDLTLEARAQLRERLSELGVAHRLRTVARRLLDPPSGEVHPIEDQAAG